MTRTNSQRFLLATLLCIGVAATGMPVATAQEATPVGAAQTATGVATPVAALDVPLLDPTGAAVGLATFSEDPDGVSVVLLIEGLAPGEHGWHLHEFGVCDPGGDEPFASAGEHWNPTAMMHGGPEDAEHHAGDFGNLTADEAGLAETETTTSDFTLGDGPTSVFDEDGTAIVIHEGADDLETQPSGDSGAGFACGVVAEATAAPASPVAAATPVG